MSDMDAPGFRLLGHAVKLTDEGAQVLIEMLEEE